MQHTTPQQLQQRRTRRYPRPAPRHTDAGVSVPATPDHARTGLARRSTTSPSSRLPQRWPWCPATARATPVVPECPERRAHAVCNCSAGSGGTATRAATGLRTVLSTFLRHAQRYFTTPIGQPRRHKKARVSRSGQARAPSSELQVRLFCLKSKTSRDGGNRDSSIARWRESEAVTCC